MRRCGWDRERRVPHSTLKVQGPHNENFYVIPCMINLMFYLSIPLIKFDDKWEARNFLNFFNISIFQNVSLPKAADGNQSPSLCEWP